jgi:hypothetical protein
MSFWTARGWSSPPTRAFRPCRRGRGSVGTNCTCGHRSPGSRTLTVYHWFNRAGHWGAALLCCGRGEPTHCRRGTTKSVMMSWCRFSFCWKRE